MCFHLDFYLESEGVEGGILESSTHEVDATLQVTVTLMGGFRGAVVEIQASTFNDGDEDIFVTLSHYRGQGIITYQLDEGTLIRVRAKDLTAESDITVVTGSGNATTTTTTTTTPAP